MTQPVLFAVQDSEHSAVTEGGIIVPQGNRDHIEDRKRADIAEYLCAIELTKRGYACNVMGGNCVGYDIIADRCDIRPQFVQVKQGCPRNRKGTQCYYILNHSQNVTYGANAYDILAFYMWDRSQWLIYGRSEFGNRSMTSYTPHDSRRIARKSCYGASGEIMADRQPNNWELFNQLAIANSQESLTPRTADVLCLNP